MVEPSEFLNARPDALPAAQVAVARKLAPLVGGDAWYLGGGTAGTLQLGHRRSVDLDYFYCGEMPTPETLGQDLLHLDRRFEVRQTARGALHGVVDGVPVSFFEFRYPLIGPAAFWAEGGCRVASLDDFAAMKLSAISQRGHRKDFYDIYALVTEYRPLSHLLDCYSRRFGVRDPGHVLMGLTFFDDADNQRDPVLLWTVTWPEVKRALVTWIREFTAG